MKEKNEKQTCSGRVKKIWYVNCNNNLLSQNRINKFSRLVSIEDGADLKIIEELAAKATSKANKVALKVSHEIVEVRGGKLIRKVKGRKSEVIKKLRYRTVNKGDVQYL